jgi:hypothetical protein
MGFTEIRKVLLGRVRVVWCVVGVVVWLLVTHVLLRGREISMVTDAPNFLSGLQGEESSWLK